MLVITFLFHVFFLDHTTNKVCKSRHVMGERQHSHAPLCYHSRYSSTLNIFCETEMLPLGKIRAKEKGQKGPYNICAANIIAEKTGLRGRIKKIP